MKKNICFYISLLCFFTSCTWDKLPLEGNMVIPCDPVVTLSPNTQDTCFEFDSGFENMPMVFNNVLLERPEYNPLDAYQLICTFWSDTVTYNDYYYMKFDICTGETQVVLANLSAVGRHQWSQNGWMMKEGGLALYKVKINGDSLTYLNEVSGIPMLNNATWIEGGEKIFCYAGTGIGANVILDKNGVSLDTLAYSIKKPSCRGSIIAGYRFINNEYYICLYDLNLKTITDIISSPFNLPNDFYNMYSVGWLNGEEIIWNDSKGIHKVNIDGTGLVTLKESCDSRWYYYLSVSPQGNGDFIVGREQTRILNDTAYIRRDILKMNADTGEEWIVNLAQ